MIYKLIQWFKKKACKIGYHNFGPAYEWGMYNIARDCQRTGCTYTCFEYGKKKVIFQNSLTGKAPSC